MNYYLYKLKFSAPVHFGSPDSALSLYSSEESFRADTLFSALCHEALLLNGEEGITQLLSEAEAGNILLTDGMPWCGEDYYIPRPFITGKPSKHEPDTRQRKAAKKLKWLPVSKWNSFADAIDGAAEFDAEAIRASFGVHDEAVRVAMNGREESLPYRVGIFRFEEDCGLYFIAGCKDEAAEEKLRILIDSLGLSGIGGKTDSGLGKFTVDDSILLNEPFDEQTEWLYDGLAENTADSYLLLTSSLPADPELPAVLNGASYQLVRRGGFIRSSSYAAAPMKKHTEYFLSAGSILQRRFEGGLRTVAENGGHAVYRYSKPVLLGVDL